MDATRARWRQRPGVLAVSIFETQPWMDLPEVGWSVEVVTDGDRALGAAIADELARLAWSVREELLVHKTPIADALEHAAASGLRPIVFADGADSTSAGGNGDGTELLAALVARPDADRRAPDRSPTPTAVDRCVAGRDRGDRRARRSAARSRPGYRPVRGPRHGRPRSRSARCSSTRRGRRPTSGGWPSCGSASVDIVLSERKAVAPRHRSSTATSAASWAATRSSRSSRPAASAPTTSRSPRRSSRSRRPGPCDSDLTRLPFRRIPRPMWPFDPELDDAMARRRRRRRDGRRRP